MSQEGNYTLNNDTTTTTKMCKSLCEGNDNPALFVLTKLTFLKVISQRKLTPWFNPELSTLKQAS